MKLNQYFKGVFSAIAGKSYNLGGIRFIPTDNKGGTIEIGGGCALFDELHTTDSQLKAYNYCSPLSSVIDRLAEKDICGELSVQKLKVEEESNSIFAKRVFSLLQNPNPLQTWKQFRAQQVVYKKIFGYCPVFAITPNGFTDKSYAKSIWNLPPWMCTIEYYTGSAFFKTNINEIIKQWVVNIGGQSIRIPPSEIFTIDDGFIMNECTNYLTPKSKISGLEYAIGNIVESMKADNTLLRKRGPLGMIVRDSNDNNGYVPMDESQKESLQSDLARYGLNYNQWQYVISQTNVKWVPMSFSVKELMTKETVKQGVEAICDRYGYPFELMSNQNGVTFDNKNSAEKYLFQNNIIPNNIGDMEEYNRYFNCYENGVKIHMSYKDLPILQEDELQKANSDKIKTEYFIMQYDNSIITKNQLLNSLGYEQVVGGDIYKQDVISNNNLDNLN